MQEDEYRKWLVDGRVTPGSASGYLSYARRIEEAYGDLDELYDGDRFEKLLLTLKYTTSDERAGRENPTKIKINKNIREYLSNYRSLLRSYSRFRRGESVPTEQPTPGSLNRSELDKLKAIFNKKYPDFESLRFRANEGGYWTDERKDKNDILEAVGQLQADTSASEEEIGRKFMDLIRKPPIPFIHWLAFDHIQKTNIEQDIANYLGGLLRSSGGVADVAAEAAVKIYDCMVRGEGKSPFGRTRILATVPLAFARPKEAIVVKTQSMRNVAKRLTGSRLFENNVLTANEYRGFLNLSQKIFEIMKEDWQWAPRDLWDVQGFLWVAIHEGKEVPNEDMDEDMDEDEDDMINNVLVPPTNLILHGPPGTGKTYVTAKKAVERCDKKQLPDDRNQVMQRYRELIEQKRISFVTFHQSYAYEDFVEGLRPDTGEGSGGGFTLKPHPGIFRRIADLARANESEPYVLIIDEINRANVSKVFGELITLIEPDKRLRCENELTVSLPYSGDTFGIPANLHLIGTMNTADRSIALLDTALRRRFEFEEMMPDPALLDEASNATGIDVESVLTQLNKRIEYLFDRDHQIGHAFFMNCKTQVDLDDVMRHKVIPLLVEYFYEDWEKVRQVLNESTDEGSFVGRIELRSPTTGEDGAPDIDRWRYEVRSRFAPEAYNQLMQ